MFLPSGENERLIAKAGFELLEARDVTGEAEVIARRWHDARQKHRAALIQREGTGNFEGLQRFLSCVHRLSAERRLSRYCYLARRGGVTG